MIFDDELRATAEGAGPLQTYTPDNAAILTNADDMKAWLPTAAACALRDLVDNCVRGRSVDGIDFSGRNQSMSRRNENLTYGLWFFDRCFLTCQFPLSKVEPGE